MSEAVTPFTTYPPIPTGVITRQPGAKLKTTRDGATTLTETYVGNFSDLLSSPLVVTGGNHAEFPTLVVWSNEILQGKGGIGTLTVESRGCLGDLPDATYTLDRATHNEPLSTHPLWVAQIAGTPNAPLNGAIFVSVDKTGTNYNPAPSGGNPGTFDPNHATFSGWTTGSIFEGVEDYLLAGSTYSINYADYNQPDLSGVGQLATPDGAPDTPSGFFWLYTGASSTLHGNIYRISETYLLTGGVNQQATTILYGSN